MSVVEALKGFRAELAETPAGLPRVRRAAKLSLLCAKELLGTAALAPFALRAQLTHRGLLGRRRHHALHGVAYGPAQRQLMDVYFPVDGGGAAGAEGKAGPGKAGPGKAGPSPVAVFVHGGVWSSGEAWHYAPLGAQLAEEGVVCFVPTYSLYPSATVDKQVVEVGQALDFAFQTAEQFGGDPENVTLLGHSAGAQLGLLEVLYRAGLGKGKGRRSSRKQPRKFVGMAGCYDIRKHWWYEHGRGVHRLSTMERAFGGRDRFHMLSPACLLQDTFQDQFTPDARAGPPLEGELEGRALAWVAHIAEEQRNLPSGALPSSLGGHPYAAPMPDCFLLAGLMDQTVPWAWSADMHAKLNRAGVRSENLVYDQAGHGDFVVGWGHGSGPRTPPYVADAVKIIKRAG